MFIDKVSIFVTAGTGGPGCISFRREKYVPMGGPDGGNGGKGGDVYLEADPHLTTLMDVSYRPHYVAENACKGGASNRSGKSAPDLVIKLPLGTVVFKKGVLLVDLKDPCQKVLVAVGGRGGRGNSSFKTGRHTAPKIAERGEPGEETELNLELKVIADVGLLGFPNAGKSTFLSRVSSAKPKIADYPFTTLVPNLGVVYNGEKHFVLADIPGLIQGAHKGKGLGFDFLRHIQRTKVLLHFLDSSGFEGKTAYQNFKTINKELSSYSKILLKKPVIIVLTKMDLTDSATKLVKLKKYLKTQKIFPISAVTGQGVKELLNEIFKVLKTAPPPENVIPEQVKKYVYEPEFTVVKQDGLFIVSGKKIEILASMTEFGYEDALRRFQNIIRKKGIEKELERLGIVEGDTVRIGDVELLYEK